MTDKESRDPSKKAHEQALVEFRRRHFDEMEKNLEVAKSIRDNVKEAAKNRIEAGKLISRMLGTLAPEKADTKGRIQVQSKKPKLKDKHRATLDKILNDR
ncbi:MAG: hypothetical protein V3V81_08025 [Candidatus Bathyarchaeia archaeon]